MGPPDVLSDGAPRCTLGVIRTVMTEEDAMKRDPHLMDLSRDHHHALVLAREAMTAAEKGSDEDVARAWEAVAVGFETDLDPHFKVEERYLLPPMEAVGERAMAERTGEEHARLRALPTDEGDSRDRLRRFGELLRDHVRFEENELFPRAEEVLTAEALVEVAEASAATEAALLREAEWARKRREKEAPERGE